MSARVCCLFLILTGLCGPLRACTPDDEDKQHFSTWNYAQPAGGAQFSQIAYEVRHTGCHTAEVHFKNFNPKPIACTFQLPGFQNASERIAAVILPSAPDDRQTVVPVFLERGASGAAFADLVLYDIQIGGRPAPAPAAVKPPAPTLAKPRFSAADEAWFGVTTAQPYMEFGTESACCRVAQGPDGMHALFRNTSREPLFFDFIVLGLQSSTKHNPRVDLQPGEERAIPVELNSGTMPPTLARVRAFHICREIEGSAYVDAADLEDGWFAAAVIGCPTVNPNQILYHVEPAENGGAAIRFRNISRSQIRFLLTVPGDATEREVHIASETETVVEQLHFAQVIPTLTRVKVSQVVYGDNSPRK